MQKVIPSLPVLYRGKHWDLLLMSLMEYSVHVELFFFSKFYKHWALTMCQALFSASLQLSQVSAVIIPIWIAETDAQVQWLGQGHTACGRAQILTQVGGHQRSHCVNILNVGGYYAELDRSREREGLSDVYEAQ